MELVEKVYRLTEKFPSSEKFGLVSQLRRAATSIALNIAEGSAVSSPVEFRRFLDISLRSDYELMCGIEIVYRLGYCASSEKDSLLSGLDEVAAMLSGFKKKLKTEDR